MDVIYVTIVNNDLTSIDFVIKLYIFLIEMMLNTILIPISIYNTNYSIALFTIIRTNHDIVWGRVSRE